MDRGDGCVQKEWAGLSGPRGQGPGSTRSHTIPSQTQAQRRGSLYEIGTRKTVLGGTNTERQERWMEGQEFPGSPCPASHLGRCPEENQPHRIPCRSRASATYKSARVVITIIVINYN